LDYFIAIIPFINKKSYSDIINKLKSVNKKFTVFADKYKIEKKIVS